MCHSIMVLEHWASSERKHIVSEAEDRTSCRSVDDGSVNFADLEDW